MKVRTGGRPSPAMVVAVVALLFAVTGIGIAQGEQLSKAVNRGQVKSIVKKQIKKAAPELSVARAADADKLGGAPASAYATKTGNEAVRFVGTPGQPPFENGWTNYGGSYSEASFYKDQFGVVHLQGMIKPGTLGMIAFTLPEGYRPSLEHLQVAATNSGGTTAALNVFANGGVRPGAGTVGYISLENVEFVPGT